VRVDLVRVEGCFRERLHSCFRNLELGRERRRGEVGDSVVVGAGEGTPEWWYGRLV